MPCNYLSPCEEQPLQDNESEWKCALYVYGIMRDMEGRQMLALLLFGFIILKPNMFLNQLAQNRQHVCTYIKFWLSFVQILRFYCCILL